MVEKSDSWKKKAQRTGIVIFAALMAFTVLEYILSVYFYSLVGLFITMLIKSALIVYYFMHVYRLWREENH